MNERIKELWSQAGGHYNSGNQHTWPQYTIDDPEKFAELLIRETMQVVANNMSADLYRVVANAVIEHYGDEE